MSVLARLAIGRRFAAGAVLALVTSAGCRSREPASPPDAGPDLRTLSDALAELAPRVADPRRRVQLLTDLADAHGAAGDRPGAIERLVRAEGLVGHAQPPDDKEDAAYRIGKSYVRIDELEPALKSARALVRTGSRTELTSAVAVGLARAGRAQEAIEVVWAIENPRKRAEGRAAVGAALAESKRIKKATEIASDLETPKLRNQVLAAIAAAHARAGRLDEARQITRWMTAGIERSEAFAAAALGAYRAGQTDEALVLLDSIESAWIRARARYQMSRHAKRRKKAAVARRLRKKAVAEAEAISDAAIRSAAVEDLAARCARAGHVKIVKRMVSRVDDPKTKRKMLGKLITAHANAGRLDAAKALLPEIAVDAFASAEALESVAVALARAGRYSEALELATSIQTLELRSPALGRIAAAHAKAKGRMDEVLQARLESTLGPLQGAPVR